MKIVSRVNVGFWVGKVVMVTNWISEESNEDNGVYNRSFWLENRQDVE